MPTCFRPKSLASLSSFSHTSCLENPVGFAFKFIQNWTTFHNLTSNTLVQTTLPGLLQQLLNDAAARIIPVKKESQLNVTWYSKLNPETEKDHLWKNW